MYNLKTTGRIWMRFYKVMYL